VTLVGKADVRLDFTTRVREIQDVPKLVTKISVVITPEQGVTIWLGTFSKVVPIPQVFIQTAR